MVIEYTATPNDVSALYNYTRNHSLKLALVSYGLPVGLAAYSGRAPLARSHSHVSGLDHFVDVGAGVLFLIPTHPQTAHEKGQAHTFNSA